MVNAATKRVHERHICLNVLVRVHCDNEFYNQPPYALITLTQKEAQEYIQKAQLCSFLKGCDSEFHELTYWSNDAIYLSASTAEEVFGDLSYEEDWMTGSENYPLLHWVTGNLQQRVCLDHPTSDDEGIIRIEVPEVAIQVEDLRWKGYPKDSESQVHTDGIPISLLEDFLSGKLKENDKAPGERK